MSSDIPLPASRVAVLLYGPIEAGGQTASAFVRHVAAPLGAAVFHTAGRQSRSDRCVSDDEAFEHRSHRLPSHYGSFLEASGRLEAPSGERTTSLSGRLADDAVAIEQCLALMYAHERQAGIRFDQVLVTRTDVSFYAGVHPGVVEGAIELPASEGFHVVSGIRLRDTSPLRYYRNGATGDFVPDDGSASFSADLMLFHRQDVGALESLSGHIGQLVEEGAPVHWPTLLYLRLVARAGLVPTFRADWVIERRHGSDGRHPVPLPDRSSRRPEGRPRRVAVLLYGLLRDYQITARSLLNHVVAPNDASIFYFGPAQSDRPTSSHAGTFDDKGFFLSNPKAEFEELDVIGTRPDLSTTYGEKLIAAMFHDVPQSHFLDVANRVCAREEWLFMLSPHRLLSMFYNISGAVEVLKAHERKTGEEFDEVIITRPDLSFYAPVAVTVSPGELHIANGEGFDAKGHPRSGNASAYFYKNAQTGLYSPPGAVRSFNDQIIYIHRRDLVHLESIYERLIAALQERIPASPETIFYLLLVAEAGLTLIDHPEWLHEIYRADEPVIKNVADTPDIVNIDPRHHKAVRFMSMASTARAEPLSADHGSPPRPRPAQDLAPPLVEPRSADNGDGGVHLLNEMLTREEPGGRSLFRKLTLRSTLRRARSLRRRGNLAAAQESYARVLQMAPDRQREWVQFGHVMKDRGDLIGARAAYGMALVLAPGDADAALHQRCVEQDLARQS